MQARGQRAGAGGCRPSAMIISHAKISSASRSLSRDITRLVTASANCSAGVTGLSMMGLRWSLEPQPRLMADGMETEALGSRQVHVIRAFQAPDRLAAAIALRPRTARPERALCPGPRRQRAGAQSLECLGEPSAWHGPGVYGTGPALTIHQTADTVRYKGPWSARATTLLQSHDEPCNRFLLAAVVRSRRGDGLRRGERCENRARVALRSGRRTWRRGRSRRGHGRDGDGDSGSDTMTRLQAVCTYERLLSGETGPRSGGRGRKHHSPAGDISQRAVEAPRQSILRLSCDGERLCPSVYGVDCRGAHAEPRAAAGGPGSAAHARRVMDEFEIDSTLGVGTTVTVRKYRP